MKILAIETSSDACSVALDIDGEVVSDHRIASQQHAQLLLPMIDRLMANAGISANTLNGVAFGAGPGSFTGLRIAAATAQGIAFGADIGVLPVSSLQAVAQGVCVEQQSTQVAVGFDARMDEVYWGAFECDEAGMIRPSQQERVCAPTEITLPVTQTNSSWIVVGTGADRYIDVLSTALPDYQLQHIKDVWPHAQYVARIAKAEAETAGFKPANEALPVYLRDKVALTEAERASK